MRRLAVATALLVACGDNATVPSVPLVSGDASLTVTADGSLVLARGGTTLLTFGAESFKILAVDDLEDGESFDPFWLDMNGPPVFRAQHGGLKVQSSSPGQLVLEIEYDNATATVTFTPGSAGTIAASFVADTHDAQKIAYYAVHADGDANEGFYGLGEWGDSVNHRGKRRPMQMEIDSSLESMDDENHVPVPLLLGTTGWGMFFQSDRPGLFDVATQTATGIDVTFGTAEESPNGLTFDLFAEAQPLDLVAHYYDLTGYPGLPATWAYGPMLWRDENSNEAQVFDDIAQIRQRHLATTGIWFDRPYSSGVETFDWDPNKFDDPGAMLQAAHAAGLRYAIWQAPYTAMAGKPDPAPDQLAYATANGYFPPVTGVLINNWGKPIDFTNPDAYAWWQQNLRMYTDPLGAGGWGVEGFKLDYAEDVVIGLNGAGARWEFADGSDERTAHYAYTMLYHRIHREVMPQSGGFLLTRTGRWGDQVRGMIIWPGDLDASFAKQGDPLPGSTMTAVGGLPASLIKAIGLGPSGFPFYASDTGGYRSSPADVECWTRWAEANAVQSGMNVGDASSEQPWDFTTANGRDQTALDTYAKYALLHLRLWPYAWTYAEQIAKTGRPIVRAFGLAHPEVGQHPDDEYLFGDDLLVAPVVAAGQTSRDVWLPPGDWIGWWDGATVQGGATGAKVNVAAPLDTLPLFVRAGAVVPMLRDTIDTLSPVTDPTAIDSFDTTPGVLWVRAAPGGSQLTTFTVFDGTAIAQNGNSLTYAPGAMFSDGALFERIGTPMPSAVSAGGTPLAQQASLAALQLSGTGWFWDGTAAGGTLWIEVGGAATTVMVTP